MRKSRITPSDCLVLGKYMSDLQRHIVEYAAEGFCETGIHNDLLVMVSIHELHERLGKIIERKLPSVDDINAVK